METEQNLLFWFNDSLLSLLRPTLYKILVRTLESKNEVNISRILHLKFVPFALKLPDVNGKYTVFILPEFLKFLLGIQIYKCC